MPPYAMTRKAIAATANAPTMKRRVFRRMASLAVGSVMIPPGRFLAQSRDDAGSVNDQHDRGHRVGGHDEAPTAGNHPAHIVSPNAGGGTSSYFNRIEATRARNMMKAVIKNRIPNAFIRSGSQNWRDTVLGLDCS